MEQLFNQDFLDELLVRATESPRLRQNYDLRTSASDTSQRMMNALQPDTDVPIHRHEDTTETVICLRGRMEEIIYEEVDEASDEAELVQGRFKEVARYLLCPSEGQYGIQIPVGAWHTIRVIEPSVIFEAKDGAYKPIAQ
jgi:cupin fold WbuC family metalloprotein